MFVINLLNFILDYKIIFGIGKYLKLKSENKVFIKIKEEIMCTYLFENLQH